MVLVVTANRLMVTIWGDQVNGMPGSVRNYWKKNLLRLTRMGVQFMRLK